MPHWCSLVQDWLHAAVAPCLSHAPASCITPTLLAAAARKLSPACMFSCAAAAKQHLAALNQPQHWKQASSQSPVGHRAPACMHDQLLLMWQCCCYCCSCRCRLSCPSCSQRSCMAGAAAAQAQHRPPLWSLSREYLPLRGSKDTINSQQTHASSDVSQQRALQP